MDAILITTGTITDDLTVARIFCRTCASVDNIVVIQIFIQDITRIRIVAFHFWNACFQLAIGIVKVEAQIVFHFSDLIIPVYSDLPSFGTKIGSILQRSTCTQHSR